MCDFAELYDECYRRARKDHRCYECQRTIRDGERYLYASSLFDGTFASSKICVRCARVRDILLARNRLSGPRSVELQCGIGALFEEIACQREHGWRAGRTCRHESKSRAVADRLLARSRADESRPIMELDALFPIDAADVRI